MDTITIEVIRNSTSYIAEEMGIVLRNTSYSPNIKDRLDFSCAILSSNGELIAQAEHIPVHLGSMAVGVKNIIDYLSREGIDVEKDDIIIVNDPYIAGTHLNDITLLKPIFYDDEIVGYVANKAHHVDVGGKVPGSISSDAKELYQEGLIIPPSKLVENGELNKELLKLITSNVRVPKFTIGDLKAQISSLNIGVERILELMDKYTCRDVVESWKRSLDYTENYLKSKIRDIQCTCEGVDYLEYKDKLININVKIEINKGKIRVDFTGTHKQIDAPLNAVYGVTVASTSFALKSIIDPEMPMNHGIFRVVDIIAPEETIVNPKKPAPVAVGNVETSQRIVDVIFKALYNIFPDKVPAASNGSMNNVVIGGKGWAFYETIGGGFGGRYNKDGVDGVHANMTNTLNTPIEVIENEYPILVLEYSLREDSGGAGKYRGGLGIRRVYKVLSDCTLSLIAERIKISPWGVNGGYNGSPGEHYIIRDGKKIPLSGKDTVTLNSGDVVVINTPGGGGYGSPSQRNIDLILEDVKDGKISIDSAYRDYKVKIIKKGDKLIVDFKERH
ncbi:hydantoinase B/oxoprolinase family protein [Methanotorris igneus]|uniref:5-oxoprolinase (ATP-hydrolyzing) n=1 Tax=Methanotorris igneus (strain DSM 5666 / JCM 11834 / Kol 5) TaxID=880724 RepID=F6BAT9_METIK|nr:hydantoinase B/oxoprolinase family protein [Methanotorris igneus]AEF95903.1 5-oxoprolinase (ATP-hydrolyzing) [Methanotorris igneus Kol 5]